MRKNSKSRLPNALFDADFLFVPFLRGGLLWDTLGKKVPEKVWEALVQSQVRFNRICDHLTHGNPAEVFPALGLAARFRKICKNKTLALLGIPPKLISKQNAAQLQYATVDSRGCWRFSG